MAWPDNLDLVAVQGFDRALLPHLRDAIDSGRVQWGETNSFAESTVASFDYEGYRYKLEEFREVVTSIRQLGLIHYRVDKSRTEAEKEQKYGSWGSF